MCGSHWPSRLVALTTLAISFTPATIWAQTLDGGIRERGAVYNPVTADPVVGGGSGFGLKRFVVQPRASVRLSYDDNIDASDKNRRDDIIGSTDVGVRLQSRFRRHALGAFANAGYEKFFQNGSESGFRWLVGADSRLDFTPQTSGLADIRYTRDTEDAEDAASSDDSDDNVFHDIAGGVSINQELNKLNWNAGLRAFRREFESNDAADRDRSRLTASATLGYQLTDRITPGLGVQASRTNYDRTEEGTGRDRDESSYSVISSLAYRATERLTTQAFFGYGWEYSDDPDDNDSDGFIVGAGLEYQASERLSGRFVVFYNEATNDSLEGDGTAITFEGALDYVLGPRTNLGVIGRRTIEDTDVTGANEEIRTDLEATVTRIITSTTSLTGSAGISRSEFDGLDRDDDTIFGRLTYTWAFTDRLNLDLSYRYSQRFSDADNEDFYRNIVTVGLSAVW